MSAPSINEINQTIMFGNFNDDQLNSIWMAVKYAKGQLARKNIYTCRVGETVRYKSGRSGQLVTGKVVKLGSKFVQVQTGATLWRVPANMLEAV